MRILAAYRAGFVDHPLSVYRHHTASLTALPGADEMTAKVNSPEPARMWTGTPCRDPGRGGDGRTRHLWTARVPVDGVVPHQRIC